MPRCIPFAALLASTVLAAAALAGDLNPPAGPVAPTLKPLREIEPRTAVQNLPGSVNSQYVISQPGSYYLIGNIQGVAGLHGIEIDADDVTLDLCGFELNGVPAGPANKHGVHVSSQVNVAIRNGVIARWTGNGINLAGNGNALIESIRATNNPGAGIYALVANVIVQNCVTSQNANGITVGGLCRVSNCIANQNSQNGIEFSGDCLIERCTADFNAQIGLKQTIGSGSTLANNICTQNAIHGMSVCGTNFITGNTCSRNGTAVTNGAGIQCRCGANRVDSNLVSENDIGIECFDGGANVVIRNNARLNTTNNYVPGVGNDWGPIGNAATATSPWANFSN